MAVSPERKAYLKEWRKTEKAMTYQREYHRQDFVKEKDKEHKRRYRARCPWIKTLDYIQGRCAGKLHLNYQGKGIRNFLTPETIKMLWLRDKAYLLAQPSIDRKDSKGDYTVENCRFIELAENRLQGNLSRVGMKYKKRELNPEGAEWV